MALTTSAPTNEFLSFSFGTLKLQVVKWTAATGATSGVITADRLQNMYSIILGGGVLKKTAAPTFATNVATLSAFTVPTATAGTLTKGGVTYTSVALDQSANLINVAYTAGATAGAEVVTVTGNAISIQIETGVSTITQVRTAFNLSAAAAALATATGTSATTVATASASFLTGGITGGGTGYALCFGT